MKHIIMGTAGHIDHGKTALVKALTGIDCDTHKEEKARGITINLGFAHVPLSCGDIIGIIDVPGHRDFVHTMVGGASGIDFVLLVVAADSGAMPQTREHLQIMEVLGIKNGVIAITKIDLVEPEIADLAESEVRELIRGTFLEGCPIVRVSSATHEGIDELKRYINQVALKTPNRSIGGVFRLYVDRIFTVKGFGTVVTGSVTSGFLQAGDEVYLLPGEKKLRVRRLERFGEEVKEVVAGDRASINLPGLPREGFRRGAIISNRILRSTTLVDAKLKLFQNSRSFYKLWNRAIFHLGTYEHQATVHLIDCDRLIGGDTALVQIQLDTPCTTQYGDRFVIRNTSSDTTLGGGIIIDAFPLHHRKRPDRLVKSMSKIAEGKPHELVAAEVRKHFSAITHHEVADLLNVSHEKILKVVSNKLPPDIVSYTQNDVMYLIIKKEHDKLEQQLLNRIAAFHKRNALDRKGVTADELMSLARIERGSAGESLLRLLLDRLVANGKLKRVERTWALIDHSINLNPELKSQASFVARYLNNLNMKTPIMSELVSAVSKVKIDEQRLRNILRYLVEEGTVYFSEGNYIHAPIVDRCRKKLLHALSEQEEGMTVADFRDLVNGNRRICLLLLSIYDTEGVTKRSGDLRLITEKGVAMVEGGRS